MNIDRNNYEVFFLDYLEGKLTAHEVAELMVFLEEHPDLKEELDDFDAGILAPCDELVFEGKAELKKSFAPETITTENYEHYFIAFLENDLGFREQAQLQDFLARHPELKGELETFRKTFLIPDASLRYGNKKALKRGKTPVVRPLYYYVSAAAAAVLLLIGFYFFNRQAPVQQPMVQRPPRAVNPENLTAAVPKTQKGPEKVQHPSLLLAEKQTRKVKTREQKHETAAVPREEEVLLARKEISLPQGKASALINTARLDPVPAAALPDHNVKETSTATAEPPYPSIPELVVSEIKAATASDSQEKEETLKRPSKRANWAYLGAAGIQKLTGKSVNVKTKYNNKGQMTVFAISTEKFEFSKSRNR